MTLPGSAALPIDAIASLVTYSTSTTAALPIASLVVQGAQVGIVGALFSASLSAITEPVVNRVRVYRVGVFESLRQFKLRKATSFFKTTVSTNLIKFPLYEGISAGLTAVALPTSVRGGICGALFTTATLPITNYRQCKSVDMPVSGGLLYKAYLPTLSRDVVYGVTRNKLLRGLHLAFPAFALTNFGRALTLFCAVFGACLASSPGNELRGYYLQPAERRLGFRAFFRPRFYVRSTLLGAVIMATGLSGGSLVIAPFVARRTS